MNIMLKWSKSVYFWLIATFLILLAITSYKAYNNGYRQGYDRGNAVGFADGVKSVVKINPDTIKPIIDTVLIIRPPSKTDTTKTPHEIEARIPLSRNGYVDLKYVGFPINQFYKLAERTPDPVYVDRFYPVHDSTIVKNTLKENIKAGCVGATIELVIITAITIYSILK